MVSSKLKWLIVVQFLLGEQALCRIPPPPLGLRNTALAGNHFPEEVQETAGQDRRSLPPAERPGHASAIAKKEEERARSAKLIVLVLGAKLQGQIRDRLLIQGNVSCEELLSASTLEDPSSSVFPQELLGLSLVPVLAVAGCTQEAQTLVLRLYDLLGAADTEELLMEVEGLIERRISKSTSATPPAGWDSAGRHMEAVMFNIEQLAVVGEGPSEQAGDCDSWARVNGTKLVGNVVEGTAGDLEDALEVCQRLGVLCAGVTLSGLLKPGMYQAVFRKGSRILPAGSPESDCWIRQCGRSGEEDASVPAAHRRLKRSPPRSCINKSEERVYNVVEWIPAVSTLYNLGTAMYYASVNCSATAKERAILSAVDLGTDALMVATGGTAGVAGYALGAGVKTGVKAGVRYLLNNMKHEEDDVLVNQFSWEEGVITVQ